MMDKKELREQYKNRIVIGGIYAIKNTVNGKIFLDSTTDLKGSRNRFEFFGSPNPKMTADWSAQKGEGFIFEVLEELQKSETQTDKEFKDDLKLLLEIWAEKYSTQNLY